MRAVLKDYYDLVYWLQDFMEDESIKLKIKSFPGRINDWEKWLQLELEHYFNHNEIFIARREVKGKVLNRDTYDYSRCSIDLVLNKTRSRGDILIEIKCVKRANTIRKSLLKDKDKLASLIYDSVIRSKWCLGFYWYYDNEDQIMSEFIRAHKPSFHKPIRFCICEYANCDCIKMGYVLINADA